MKINSKHILVGIIIVVALIVGALILNSESDEEKIANYNNCVQLELKSYTTKMRPFVVLCADGNDGACTSFNEGFKEQEVKSREVCKIYLQ